MKITKLASVRILTANKCAWSTMHIYTYIPECNKHNYKNDRNKIRISFHNYDTNCHIFQNVNTCLSATETIHTWNFKTIKILLTIIL